MQVVPRTNPAWFAGRNSATLPSFTVKLAMAAAALTARKNSKEEISHAQSAANQSTSLFGSFPSKEAAFNLLWRSAQKFLLIFMGVWTCFVGALRGAAKGSQREVLSALERGVARWRWREKELVAPFFGPFPVAVTPVSKYKFHLFGKTEFFVERRGP